MRKQQSRLDKSDDDDEDDGDEKVSSYMSTDNTLTSTSINDQCEVRECLTMFTHFHIQYELDVTLSSDGAAKVFAEFSSREFTIENFLFLYIVNKMMGSKNDVDMVTLGKQARFVYHMVWFNSSDLI